MVDDCNQVGLVAFASAQCTARAVLWTAPKGFHISSLFSLGYLPWAVLILPFIRVPLQIVP